MLIWKHFWLIDSLHTRHMITEQLDSGFVVSQVGSFRMLQLHCSIHLVGCFIWILTHFHSFRGVSPHPGLVMHLIIMRHTLLRLEVLVLYPSCLSSVGTLHTVGGNLWMAHMDCSLSLIHTHTHTRRDICSIAHSNFKVRLSDWKKEVRFICLCKVSSGIREERPSCGSIHPVSTANHKQSQIAGRCRHAQEFNHLKSWPHYAQHTHTHTHRKRESKTCII